MRIQKLCLDNFRCFDHMELDLHDRLTLLVGLNASGKTALLDGLAIALGTWLGGTSQATAEQRAIHKTDARLLRQEQGGLPTISPSFPVRISAHGTVYGKEVSWVRELRKASGKTTYKEAKDLRQLAAEAERAATETAESSLPLLAYYGTGRLWVQKRDRKPRQKLGSRMQGYAACLQSAQNTRLFERWMAWRTEDRLQRIAAAQEEGADLSAVQSPHLDAVTQAAISCLDGARRFFYSANHRELRLELTDGRVLPFDALSDGQRSLVVLAADLAWRSAQLNPHLGRRAPQETSGVVLIDEIELHLHPAWERRVVEDLTRTFPLIQFVITTHSPQVIATARPEWMRVVRPTDIERLGHVRGRDTNTILREIQGVMERPEWMHEELARLEAAIEEERLDDADVLLERIRSDLGESDPTLLGLTWELGDRKANRAVD